MIKKKLYIRSKQIIISFINRNYNNIFINYSDYFVARKVNGTDEYRIPKLQIIIIKETLGVMSQRLLLTANVYVKFVNYGMSLRTVERNKCSLALTSNIDRLSLVYIQGESTDHIDTSLS
ncbi:hypothetical protein PYW08_009001 [Mythimna loreyi]|uniref:Uncharacterized protein n=1 Tax=Mythimna loreyi TaxID=667449 RepID=A0ACC2Q873_9NEOP|nr:hypothetical protein PYW08_009001 [Mythimna loreyi]